MRPFPPEVPNGEAVFGRSPRSRQRPAGMLLRFQAFEEFGLDWLRERSEHPTPFSPVFGGQVTKPLVVTKVVGVDVVGCVPRPFPVRPTPGGRTGRGVDARGPGRDLPLPADAASRLWARAVQGRGVGFPLSVGAGSRCRATARRECGLASLASNCWLRV